MIRIGHCLGALLLLLPLSGQAQLNDCSGAFVLCTSEPIGFNPIGPGQDDFADPDNNPGCMTALEQNSAWYYFQIDPMAPPGLELGFTISPLGGFGEDYDWALFGPNVDCGNLGSPIRCSSSSAQCGFCPETGMGMGTTDFSEGPGTGDGFVSTLIVQPGQGFYLLIDNWQGTNNGFILTWTGSAAEHLDCEASPPCALYAVAGNALSACEGSTFQLNGSSTGNHGGETYSWTGTNGGTAYLSDPNSPTPMVELPVGFTGTIIYTLTVEEDTCMHADAVEVTVNPLPEVTINPIGPFCANDDPQMLTAIPAGGVWGGAAIGNDFHPQVSGPGIHTVTYLYTDINGCMGSAELDIEVYTLPDIVVDPDPATFCDNEGSLELTATGSGVGAFAYAWNTPSGPGTENTYVATGSGIHTVSVTDGNGCVNQLDVTVMNFPNPDVEIMDPGPICVSLPSLTLTATPPGGTWEGDVIDPSGELYPINIAPGTYTVSYTYVDGNNCDGSDDLDITIIPVPTAIAGNTGPVCEGQPFQLTGETDGMGMVIIYNWSGPNGYTSNVQNPMDATAGGTYILEVTVDGCPSQPGTTVVNVVDAPDAMAANGGPYCGGETIQLMGSTSATGPGVVFAWSGPNGYTSNAQNPADATAPGIYTLVVSNGSCSSAPVTTEVVFGNAPDATASNTGPYCPGEAILLSGSTTATGTQISYEWSGPNGYQSSAQYPADAVDAGVYQLIVVVDGCLSAPVTTDVVIFPAPLPVISGQDSICSGFSSTLDAGTGYMTYAWSDGSDDQMLTVSTGGVYEVTVTDDTGCTGTASVLVTELPSLAVTISGPTAFCEGTSTTLNAGAGYAEYRWSTGDTGPSIVVTEAGTYSLTVTDDDGCTGDASVNVTEHPNPTVTIGGSTTYCIGGSTVLDAGAGYASYAWSTNAPSQVITVSMPGSYSVTVTDADGCVGSASADVTESTSLSPVITGLPAFCAGESTVLNAGSGFATYQWSDGSAAQTLNVATPGTYSVTVGDGQGCWGADTVNVVEVAPPVADVVPAISLCQSTGGPLSLDLYDSILSGDASGTWVDADQSGALGAFDNLDFSPVLPGDYRFIYTTGSAMAPCAESEYTLVVTVLATPDAEIAVPDTLTCANPMLQLDATGSSSGGGFEIAWTGPGVVANGNELTLRPTVDAAGTYRLTITNLITGCLNTATVEVYAMTDLPSHALIVSEDVSCFGGQDATILIGSVTGGTPPYLYSLNGQPFSSTSSFAGLPAGTYDVALTDVNGCRWDTLITLTEPPALEIDLGADIEIGLGENAGILAEITPATAQIDTILWSPANQVVCVDPACLEVMLLPAASGSIQATVIDSRGCRTTDQLFVSLNITRRVYFPNVFSPNGDGINDVFGISVDPDQVTRIGKFLVMSRWGELLHEATDFDPADPAGTWDGRFRDAWVNPGVYTWYAEIEFVDGLVVSYHGDVTLLR